VPSPQTTLALLLGAALGAAGIIQGLNWKSAAATGDLTQLQNQLRIAGEENEMLKRENESLRSLAQGGGDLSVPPELISRVEKELGLHFRSTPAIQRTTTEELRDRIAAEIESRFGPQGLQDRQESYSLIGLLRPDDDLLAQLTAVASLGTLAWFDDATGEGWMLDKTDLKNIPDQAALCCLLARILLHQHFPPPGDYPGDDAARAREALHQGSASGVQARFMAEMARTIGFMPMKQNLEVEQLLAALSPFIQGLTNFPNLEGKGYADSLHIKGDEALHAALRQPPLTTRAVLLPGEPNNQPAALTLPSPPEEPFLTESVGLLGLRLWLEAIGDAGAAGEIAMAWKNDRYLLFPDGQSSSAVLWEIELDSATAADQLQAVAVNLAAALAGQQEDGALGKIIHSPENRYLLVTRPSPTHVRFLNTAVAATAEQLSK
jgi:hypothetical protein